MYVLTVVISPPVNIPCSSRNTTSRQIPRKPAAGPLWYVGRHPWSTVPVPGTNLVCATSMETAMGFHWCCDLDAPSCLFRDLLTSTISAEKNKQKVEVQKTSCQRQVTEEHSKNGQEGCNLATEDITNQTSVPMTLLVAKLLVLHRCGLSLLLLQLLWFVYDICLRLLLNWLRYLTIII